MLEVSQQSTINNQQSTINNQQSTINIQQSILLFQRIKKGPVLAVTPAQIRLPGHNGRRPTAYARYRQRPDKPLENPFMESPAAQHYNPAAMSDSKNKLAKLALEDGTVFTGRAFGAAGTSEGEVVFNTSMTGYQEILTDPSYKGQIVTMTYPLIGNYGINREDVESKSPHVAGFIIKELSPIAFELPRRHEPR